MHQHQTAKSVSNTVKHRTKVGGALPPSVTVGVARAHAAPPLPTSLQYDSDEMTQHCSSSTRWALCTVYCGG